MKSATAEPASPLVYDPFSTSAASDPYPLYAALRARAPVHYARAADAWVLARFGEVQSAARDRQTFSSAGGVDLDDTGELFGPGFFIDTDPPLHERLRRAVQPAFGPKRLAETLSASIAQIVDDTISHLRGRPDVDLAKEFASLIPLAVMTTLFGFPTDDREFLAGLTQDATAREVGVRAMPQRARQGIAQLRDYLALALAEGTDQRHEIVAVLQHAQKHGTLTSEEAIGVALFLWTSGVETTAALLGNALLALATRNDERAVLLDHRCVGRAIEELLRFDAPVQYLARTATRDVTINGVTIPEGSRVVLLYGSANRDEQRFPDSEMLHLRRDPQRHLAFGEGIHHCLGAPLARLEARLALPRLLRGMSEYEIDGSVERLVAHTVRGIATLPVRVAWRG